MNTSKKLLSLILALVLVLSTTAVFAAENYDLKHVDTKAEIGFFELVDDSVKFFDVLDNLDKYVMLVNGKYYKASEINAKTQNGTTINDAIVGLNPVEIDKPDTGELEVVDISAINKTTIRVLFSNGIESNFTVDPLKDGSNPVSFVYDGKTYTGTVNWVEKAAVESVEFDNYRQMRVTFNTLVDEETATNPYNYYFEIVEGDVADDPLGAAPTLQNTNQLSKIETDYPGWWADGHIFVNDEVKDKTQVIIQFPEDARFTNRADTGNVLDAGTGEDGLTNDDERTLHVTLADGTTNKALVKNTTVVVSVRNVKNADKIRNIDTSRHEMLILDTEGPELVEKRRVRDDKAFDDHIVLLSTTTPGQEDLIELEYDEPVFDAHDLETQAINRNIKLYINGKFVADTEETDPQSTGTAKLSDYLEFNMDFDNSYNESRIATLNVAKAAANTKDKTGALAPEPFKDGETLRVRILGVTDLAGNIQVPSEIQFDVDVEDPSSTTDPVEKPEVLGVAQVADNIFRVEFNRANATGQFFIENADGEKGEIKTTTTEYNLPLSKAYGGKFYSYITVNAIDVDIDSAYPYDDPNDEDHHILAYDGQTQLDRTVRVRNVWSVDTTANVYQQKGDNWKEEMVPIVKDTLAPKIVVPTAGYYKVDHDDPSVAAKTLTLDVEDILPDSWTGDYQNPVKALLYNYNDNIAGDIDRNVIEAFGADAQLGANEQYLPIRVSYVTDKGVTRSALLFNGGDLPQNPKPTGAVATPISYAIGTNGGGTLTLDLTGYTSLLDNDNDSLVKGVEYKVEVLKGFFADPELEDIDNGGTVNTTNTGNFETQVAPSKAYPVEDLSGVNAGTAYTSVVTKDTTAISGKDLTDFEVLHVSQGRTLDNSPTVIGKGYSSKEQVIRYQIGEKQDMEVEGMVPQTSKELIKYDRDTNEMKIEFKGEIDVATLKKAANYTLNGKTLAAWGVKDSEIVFKQDFDASGDLEAQYAIFEVPQDSVPQDGDVQIIVEGVKNPVGATMLQVIADVFLLDNTRPVVTKAVKQGDNQIVLTFDEPIEFKEGSNQFTSAKNFIMKINGVEMMGSVLEARLVDGERKVTLQLGIDITATTGDIVVVIVPDESNNINIIDQAKHKNPLKDGYTIEVQR